MHLFAAPAQPALQDGPPPRSGPHPHRTVPPDTSANRAGARPAAGSGQPGSGQVSTDQPGQISRVRLAGQLDSSGQLVLGQRGSPGLLGPPAQLEPGLLQRLATQCFFRPRVTGRMLLQQTPAAVCFVLTA